MDRPDTIVTPESVAFDLQPAGLGSRVIAAVLDTVVLTVAMTAISFGFAFFYSRLEDSGGLEESWVGTALVATAVFVLFTTVWAYYVVFEVFRNGQTPGKRRMGLQVVRENGQGLTLLHSGLRNILRLVDFMPTLYVVGFLFVAASARGKRLGDHAAGTIVVEVGAQSSKDLGTQLLLLPEDEARLAAFVPGLDRMWLGEVKTFLEMRQDLTPGVRAIRAAKTVERLHEHISLRGSYSAEELLIWVARMAESRGIREVSHDVNPDSVGEYEKRAAREG